MATLNHVIYGLRGRKDQSATQIVEHAQQRLKQLRIDITRSKPLTAQTQTLEDLVDGRGRAFKAADVALQEAQKAFQKAQEELSDAEFQLNEIQAMHNQEMASQMASDAAGAVAGSHLQALYAVAARLPPEQASVAHQGLQLLVPLLVSAGVTPPRQTSWEPSPAEAAHTGSAGASFECESAPTPAPITPPTRGARSPNVQMFGPAADAGHGSEWGEPYLSPPRSRRQFRSRSPAVSRSCERAEEMSAVPRRRVRAKSTAPTGFPTWYPPPADVNPEPVAFRIPHVFRKTSFPPSTG